MSLITINLTVTADVEAVLTILRRIDSKIDSLANTGATMTKELDDVRREIQGVITVDEGVVILLGMLSQKVRDTDADKAALSALAAEIDAQTNNFVADIIAHTQAAAPPVSPIHPGGDTLVTAAPPASPQPGPTNTPPVTPPVVPPVEPIP